MQLVMLRHAATAGNSRHCYVGRRTDEPLNDAGRAQCRAAGTFPAFELVYASPMKRAQETARLCFPAAHIETVTGLEEYDFGDFEGKTANQMANDARYHTWVESNCTTQCPHGDSRASYLQRSNTALAGMLHRAARNGENQVVLVAHGGTIMAAMTAFSREQRDYFDWQVNNCEGYRASVALGANTVQLSECEHIRPPLAL